MSNNCTRTETEIIDIDNTARTMPSDSPMIDSSGNGDVEAATPPKRSYWCSLKPFELFICLIPIPIGVYMEFHDPYERPIPYQIIDGTIINAFQYDLEEKGETVPNWAMTIAAMALPVFIQIILILCTRPRIAFDKSDAIHKTFCVYALSIGLTQSLTNFAKLYCGYLRPVFLDLCQPDENWQCTGDPNDLHQGRVSFMSGHASLSFCGLLVFSYFLEGHFGYSAYKKKLASEPPSSTPEPLKLIRIVSVLCYAPMLVAFFIALSRVHDDHHHPADVVGGTLLGGTIASLIYSIWF